MPPYRTIPSNEEPEQLEDLGEALLDFTSQSDLINWFNYLEENKKNIR